MNVTDEEGFTAAASSSHAVCRNREAQPVARQVGEASALSAGDRLRQPASECTAGVVNVSPIFLRDRSRQDNPINTSNVSDALDQAGFIRRSFRRHVAALRC